LFFVSSEIGLGLGFFILFGLFFRSNNVFSDLFQNFKGVFAVFLFNGGGQLFGEFGRFFIVFSIELFQ